MKILHAYVLRSLIVNFFIGLVVFVAVLFTGFLIKEIAGRLVQGIALSDIAKLFFLLIPLYLSICIPMSFLTSLLLIFGRMSQDNEILAMKASGIPLYQVCTPIWYVAAFLTVVCFRINNETIPYSHFAARKLMIEMGIKNPTAFLEAGNFVEIFPNHIIYVYEKQKDQLKRIVIYQTAADGQVKTITAREGSMTYDTTSRIVRIELKDGAVQEPAAPGSQEFYNLQFTNYTVKLDASELYQDPEAIRKKHKDMTIQEIRSTIDLYRSQGVRESLISPFKTEIQKKIAVSFSCIAFALLGVPLGIRAHRSEKTVGVGLSLLLVFLYYLFTILCKALNEVPAVHPEILIWMPNAVLSALGVRLLRRVAA